jgi:hypothetical protein
MAQPGYDDRRRGVDRDSSWDRIARATGIAFAVLAAIAFLISGGPADDASGDEVIRYFRDNETQVEWQAFVFGLAGLFFLWFGGTLASIIRRGERLDSAGAEETAAIGRLAAITVAATGASAALYFAGIAASSALAKAAGEEGAPAALYHFADQAFALTNFTAAAFVGAVSLGIMRTRVLPDWVGWAGAALLALGVVNGAVELFGETVGAGALGKITFFAFLVWVALISVLLSMGTVRRRTGAATTA